MSVIQESQTGTDLIVIQDFNACPQGEEFSWATSRQFHIGDRVRFASFYQDNRVEHLPGLGWTVVVETMDGTRYAATQTLFVTEECWQALKKFFAKRLLREPKRRGQPRS